MKIEKTVTAQKQNKQGTISITLPKVIVDTLGFKAGDLMTFILDTEHPETITLYKR